MNITATSERLVHADLARLVKYCDALAAGRPMPRREDFRPTDVRWMIGKMYMIDVLDDGADYCFRLFGNFWQTIYGVDLTGRRLSALEASGNLTALRPVYDAVAKTREPLFQPGKLVWPNQKSISYERLLLPFSNNDGRVSLILAAAHCDMTVEDLVLYRGCGLPQLVIDGQIIHSPSSAKTNANQLAAASSLT